MARGNGYDYFKMFVKSADYAVKAAQLLKEITESFDADRLSDKIREMHTIEHEADMAKHQMNSALIKEFLPPIDREDIMLLSQNLDDVTDCIDDVALRMHMYNVMSVRDDAKQFVDVVLHCCEALFDAMQEFSSFRKSASIQKKLVEVNRLEEEGDKLHAAAMRKLFLTASDPVQVIVWSQLYDRFERCCDAAEHAANQVERIIMKNS